MMKTFFVFSLAVLFVGCAGSRPARLGVTEGKFIPCPDSPNCVSSQSPDQSHAIEPLSYKGTPSEARARLLAVIKSRKRTNIVTEQEHYIHAEFTSAVFRFVDDAEFYVDNTQKVIHVRSAARLGYYDFAVNRKRMETIRQLFNKVSP